MSTNANLTDQTTTTNPAVNAKIAYFGVAVGATAAVPKDVDNPDTVATVLGGYGNLVEGAAAGIRASKSAQVVVPVNASIAAVLGAVTCSPAGGPAITAAAAAGGPYDSFNFKLEMTLGGALGTSRFRWALDGSSYQGEDYTPTESAAQVTGTVDISFGMDLNALTLVFTAPSSTTLTFPAGPFAASATNALHAATATVAAPVTLTTADLVSAAVTLLDGANGSRLVFTTAGVTPADAPASVTITGVGPDGVTAVTETLSLAQTATSVTSVNRYRGTGLTLVFAAADGTAATIAIGYSDTYPTAQSIADEFNTLAAAAPLNVRAKVVQGKYLQTYSTATGSSATQTISASSTADTVLGLSNSAATGSPATFTPPNTGVTFTFPTGTYRIDDVYSCTTTGPRFDTTALGAAMDGLFADKTKTWDDIVILQPCYDGAETLAFANAISTKLSTWRSTTPRKATFAFLPSSLGGTGTSNITANDNDVKTACASFTDPWVAIVHGDGYATGTLYPGKMRRPLVHGVGILACSRRFSADLGSRDFASIPEFDLVSPDGTINARDENSAAVKMYARQSPGQRFTVAKLDGGLAYIVKSISRALVTSKFRHVGVMRLGRAALNLANAQATTFENIDPLLNNKGKLRETYAAGRENAVQKVFKATLVDAPAEHASDVKIKLDRNEVVSQTDNVTINGEIQIRGQAENVTFNVGVVGELSVA